MQKCFKWVASALLAISVLSSCAKSIDDSISQKQVWNRGGQRKETVLYSDSGEDSPGRFNRIRSNGGDVVFSVLENGTAEKPGDLTEQSTSEETEERNELFYYVRPFLDDAVPLVLFQVNTVTTDVLDYWPDGEGNVYYITLEMTETDENINLRRCGLDGTEEALRHLNDFYQEGCDNCYAWKVQTVPDGEILVYSPAGYLLLDRRGNKLREEVWGSEEYYSLVCISEKNRFVQIYENYGISFYVCGEGGKGKISIANLPVSSRYLYGNSSTGEALISTDSSLYSCDREGKLTQLCTWTDYGIISDNIVSFYMAEDKMHCLLYQGGVLSDVTYIHDGGTGEPAKLTLGCFGEAFWIRTAVAEYNKESECFISIVDYGQDDVTEAVNKMYNDILAQRGPDIICFESSMVNDAVLGRAGMLEDLTAYFEKSEVIGPDDIIEPLYQALDVDGKRYMLPTNFALETIITKAEWTGSEASWTPEECLKGVTENSELIFGMDRGDIADILGIYGLYCTPEASDNIETYLKIAQYLPEQRVFISDYGAKRDGKVFMDFTWLSSVESYLYEKGQWGNTIRFTGIPGAEGNGMAFVPINCYGISSRSEYKEDAWKFIESLFTKERREEVTPVQYFSARKDNLEEQFYEASKIEYYRDENGNLVERPLFIDRSEGMEFYAARQEDIEDIRKLIGETRLIRRENQAVVHIIGEEAGAFYAGDRTLKEVIDTIENRIGILSSEREQN